MKNFQYNRLSDMDDSGSQFWHAVFDNDSPEPLEDLLTIKTEDPDDEWNDFTSTTQQSPEEQFEYGLIRSRFG